MEQDVHVSEMKSQAAEFALVLGMVLSLMLGLASYWVQSSAFYDNLPEAQFLRSPDIQSVNLLDQSSEQELGRLSEFQSQNSGSSHQGFPVSQNNFDKSEYQIRSYKPELHEEAQFQALNPQQGFKTLFDNNGIRVLSDAESGKTWHWQLSLSSYGAPDYLQSVQPAKQKVIGNRIEYQRGDITEWYVNDESGLEQGFIMNRPPVAGAENIVVSIETNGNLVPRNRNGIIELYDSENKRALSYTKLMAWDANHKLLDGDMNLSGSQILLTINTRDAVYPVTIDPLITSLPDSVLNYGSGVVAAGDINGDGYADVLAGSTGAVNIYYGSANGIISYGSPDSILQIDHGAIAGAGDVNGDGYGDIILVASSMQVHIYHGTANGIASDANAATILQFDQAVSTVATAGDLNNDGYSDVLVGAPDYDNGVINGGAVFIFHGAMNTGIASYASPNAVLQVNQDGSRFGHVLSSAGDVNGDGVDDVIVSAPYYTNGQSEEGAVFVYHGVNAAGIADNAIANVILESNETSARFGESITTAGDVDADGYGDVVISSHVFTGSSGSTQIKYYVFHGSVTSLATTAEAVITTAGYGDGVTFNYSNNVVFAGDINADGYDDIVLVGSIPGRNKQDSNGIIQVYGSIFLHLGSSGSISTEAQSVLFYNTDHYLKDFDVANLGDVNGDGAVDVVVGITSANRSYMYYGIPDNINVNLSSSVQIHNSGVRIVVASAGDVNCDGYSDVIVGDWGFASVYHGSSSGLSSSVNSTLQSNVGGDRFGMRVMSAGDINGDGCSDVIVSSSVSSYVFLGSESGILSSELADPDGAGPLTGSNAAYVFSGVGISAGDVNGDGYGDIIAGNNVYHGGPQGIDETPATILPVSITADYFTSDQRGASAGDVNGDGYGDVIIGGSEIAYIFHGSASGLSPVAATTLRSNQSDTYFGFSVSSAGDINGDGYSDVIVGAGGEFYTDNRAVNVVSRGYTDIETKEGSAFIFMGSADGIGAGAHSLLQSNYPYARFGRSVSLAGDLNADGYSDVLIGSDAYLNNIAYLTYQPGGAFVFQGGLSGIMSSDRADPDSTGPLTGINESVYIPSENGYFGRNVASAGDVNGDGYDDVLIVSFNKASEYGSAYIYYGANVSAKNNRPVLSRYSDGAQPFVLNRAINTFHAVAIAVHPNGHGRSKLELEACPQGVVFGHPDCHTAISSYWTNTAPVAGVKAHLYDLDEGIYRLRARFVYSQSTFMLSQALHSKWFNPNTGTSDMVRLVIDNNADGQSDNVAPSISGVPSTIVASGAAYQFMPTAHDANLYEQLTFGVQNLPVWASFDSVTGELSGTPADADYGVYANIIISVSDPDGATAQLSPFSITVTDPSGPHINSVVVNNGNGSYTVTLSCFDAGSGCAGGLHYTTDGNTANSGSALYTGPITVNDPMQVMSWAQDNEGNVNHAQAARFVSIASPADDFIGAPSAVSGSYIDVFAAISSVVVQISDDAGNGLIVSGGRQSLQPGTPGNVPATLNALDDTWHLDFQSGIAWVSERRYHITVIATDVYGNESRVSSSFVYYAGSAVTTSLSMTLLKSSIEVNGTVDIQATLKRSDNASFDFTNQGYALVLHAEYLGSTPVTSGMSQAITGSSFITFDEVGSGVGDGNFIFNQAGYYEVWVEFAGNAILSAATSTRQVINVGSTAGYAVIIQGKLANNEGLASHNKTTKRIYNTLRSRGFADEDIYYYSYFNDAFVDGAPSKSGIGSAIAGLATKVNAKPADVYVFMVDHGGVATQSSETSFYIDNEVITPTDLDTWLDALETGLTDQTLTNRIAIVGACYSGGFLSVGNNEPNRVVISSASAIEQSFKGPEEADGIRTGELFIEYLLDELELGANLGNAFKTATRLTEGYTRKGDANAVIDSNLDTSVQHPQLNDNADNKGTNAVFVNDETVATADGQLAATLKLGFDRATDKNDAELVARILGVPGPIYLGVSNSSALSLKVNDDSLVSAAYAEIRPPQQVLSVQPLGTREQVASSYDKQGFSQSGAANSYGLTYSSFTQSGVYEVFYYANDLSGVLVEPFRSLVYRDSTGNANAPTQVTLLEPVNGATEINGRAAVFDWTDASDADNDVVTYTLFIADSPAFTSFKQANRDPNVGGCSTTAMPYIQYGLTSSSTFVDARSRLCEGTTYYWKVQAVDPYGKHSDSATFSFTTGATNNTVGVIVAMVKSAQTSLPLSQMTLSATGQSVAKVEEVSSVLYNGNYVMFINNPSGSFPLVATDPAGGYQQKQTTATVKGGETQEYVLSLSANNTVDSDGDGIADNSDNCPLVANANQLDTDADGQGNACDTDDDNDGMSDVFETTYGLNPLSASDAALDNDGDGFNNLTEAMNNTHPNVFTAPQVDTDGDGVYDNSDNCPLVANASQQNNDGDSQGDACDVDDDNDGMSDTYELLYNLNPLNASDAALDNDNDGKTNLEEFLAGSSPISAETVVNNSGGGGGGGMIQWWMLVSLMMWSGIGYSDRWRNRFRHKA